MSNHTFKLCHNIGLYPIVDHSLWVSNLAKYGVRTIQLRIKNVDLNVIENEIIKSIEIANTHSIRLFINDHWFLAIKHKAYGVHLGQEDLLTADIKAIWQSGLMLGLSTHSNVELAIAREYNPSYLALGPIFPTTSKIMPFAPQGVTRLQEWKNQIKCPLVAIGGINLNNIDTILATGHKDIALISAITKSVNPKEATQLLLHRIANYA